jgi:hypothetical protein
MWKMTARIWVCGSRSTRKSKQHLHHSDALRGSQAELRHSCIHCKTCDIKVPDQDINCESHPCVMVGDVMSDYAEPGITILNSQEL